MQPQYKKPLIKSVSFWGLSVTLILIFMLSWSLSSGGLNSLIVGTLGFILFPILAAMISLGILFLVFGIIFTVYLTRRLGGIILNKQQINKPILYTSLVFGIVIALGFVLAVAVNIPRYLIGLIQAF